MRVKLLTKGDMRTLPPIYAQDGRGMGAIAHVKFFTPDSSFTWYATEYDPATETFFGLVEGQTKEMGYFKLQDLASIRGPLGLPVERDRHFRPCAVKDL